MATTMMQSSNPAIAAMQELMKKRVEAGPMLALKMANPSKSMEEAINFLCNEVKKSGLTMLSDKDVESILVHYWDDITTMSGSIDNLVKTVALIVQGMAELKKAFENMPKPEDKTEEVAEKVAGKCSDEVVKKLSEKIEDAYVDAYARGKIKADGLSVDEATAINNRLADMNGRLDIRDDRERLKSNSFILKVAVVTLLVLGVAGIKWIQILRQENKQLTRVEWLYRSLRATAPSGNIHSIEKYMLYGTDEQRDSIKTIIVNAEASGPELRFFNPHDDWKPKPPKEEKPKDVADTKTDVATTKDTIDYTLMPHKNPKRFTPGEIEAYKQLRANPHIPEDAKPDLPEGYE